MNYTLAQIADKIQATVYGDTHYTIEGVATLVSAKPNQVTFLSNKKYRQQLSATDAGAVIITPDLVDDCPTNALLMANPYLGYALVAQLFDTTPKTAKSIHPSAVIGNNVKFGRDVCIGANAVIEDNVVLGDHVSVGAGCFIGKHVLIGKNTSLWANVTVYHDVIIGEQCLIQANTVIGSDGFGYAPVDGRWLKIPQLGSVVIGNHVEIGASTTIDRGALDNTEINHGVILDNQIQIAHNVTIGEQTAIAACSVIAGSTQVGKNCTIAGLVGINGHITIADGCVFTGMTMVTKDINQSGVYSSGSPAQTNKEWHKTNARIRKLDATQNKIKALEQQLSELNNKSDQ